MKIFHSAVLVLAIGAASISSVQARDSFSIGINVGGHGYSLHITSLQDIMQSPCITASLCITVRQ